MRGSTMRESVTDVRIILEHIKWKEIWYDPGKIFMRL